MVARHQVVDVDRVIGRGHAQHNRQQRAQRQALVRSQSAEKRLHVAAVLVTLHRRRVAPHARRRHGHDRVRRAPWRAVGEGAAGRAADAAHAERH
eukprot:4036624-Prymnesium_polylepis.1